MSVNKVEIGNKTVLDLTADTVSEDTLLQGVTAHNAAGQMITGTMKSYELPVASQTVLGGVKIDGTTITIDEAGVISTVGGGTGGAGSIIKITFEDAFAGRPYTVTDGDETITGTVPASLVDSVTVINCNSTYRITSTIDDTEYGTSVTTGDYYGQYTATLNVFKATLKVTTVSGAQVTAVSGGKSFTATADNTGKASIIVTRTGECTITAVKNGASSNSTTINITEETTYTATVNFIVLKVTSPVGSVLTIRRKE